MTAAILPFLEILTGSCDGNAFPKEFSQILLITGPTCSPVNWGSILFLYSLFNGFARTPSVLSTPELCFSFPQPVFTWFLASSQISHISDLLKFCSCFSYSSSPSATTSLCLNQVSSASPLSSLCLVNAVPPTASPDHPVSIGMMIFKITATTTTLLSTFYVLSLPLQNSFQRSLLKSKV